MSPVKEKTAEDGGGDARGGGDASRRTALDGRGAAGLREAARTRKRRLRKRRPRAPQNEGNDRRNHDGEKWEMAGEAVTTPPCQVPPSFMIQHGSDPACSGVTSSTVQNGDLGPLHQRTQARRPARARCRARPESARLCSSRRARPRALIVPMRVPMIVPMRVPMRVPNGTPTTALTASPSTAPSSASCG